MGSKIKKKQINWHYDQLPSTNLLFNKDLLLGTCITTVYKTTEYFAIEGPIHV